MVCINHKWPEATHFLWQETDLKIFPHLIRLQDLRPRELRGKGWSCQIRWSCAVVKTSRAG